MQDGTTTGSGGDHSPGIADVVVVGGGIVGRACALALRRSGRDVVLLDPADADPDRIDYGGHWTGPASFGNAGHIATEQVRPITRPSFLFSAPKQLFRFGGPLDLGWRRPSAWLSWSLRAVRACFAAGSGTAALTALLSDAMPAWQRLAAELGDPALVRDDGHLMLWHDATAFRAAAGSWVRGPSGTARAAPLPDAALAPVAARLSGGFAGGLELTGTGQVADPVLAMRSLLDRFLALGGRLVRGRAMELPEAGGGTVRLADGTLLRGRTVVLAAGVDSARLLRTIGRRLPLVAERGYHLEWRHAPDGSDAAAAWPLPPLVFPERALIVSHFGDRLRASSFVEFDREDAPPDPRKWRRLQHHVRELGFPVATPFRRWMGARPTLPDYLPAIGIVSGRPALAVATGHGHLGLTLAPRTAELAVQLLDGVADPTLLRPLDPNRFAPVSRFRPDRPVRPRPVPRRAPRFQSIPPPRVPAAATVPSAPDEGR